MEMRQQVRRIQSHPSIALWAGNNENEAAFVQNWYGTIDEYYRFWDEYIALYDGIIKDEVLKNDVWHEFIYSSPSNGKKRSNESIIHQDPQDPRFGDSKFFSPPNHIFYYYLFLHCQFITTITSMMAGIRIFIRIQDLYLNMDSKVSRR